MRIATSFFSLAALACTSTTMIPDAGVDTGAVAETGTMDAPTDSGARDVRSDNVIIIGQPDVGSDAREGGAVDSTVSDARPVVDARDAGATPDSTVVDTGGGFPDGGVPGCPSGPAGFAECRSSEECTLVINSCCGPCGTPSLDDFHAINACYVAAHRPTVCGTDRPLCPRCVAEENPNLITGCRENTCRAFDLAAPELTRCELDEDCRPRVRACCECGAGPFTRENTTAIRFDAEPAFSAMICEPDAICAECAPSYPVELIPRCISGTCTILDTRVP